MKIIKPIPTATAITLLVIFFANNLLAECNYPKKDFVIPSGTNSTTEEMVEVQSKVKALQAELESYRSCLLAEEAAIPTDSENYDELIAIVVKKHDGSIDEELAITNEFNDAVKAYKSQ